jgi:outer membrane protein assembly factor BamB
MKRALILVALAAGVSGCATIKGWFSDSKAENIEPPTVLVEFPQTINVQKVWSERVGKGSQHTGARMSMAYADGKLYAASATGDIAAFDATNGHTIWHKQIGERHGWVWHHGVNSVRWSGGPTVGGDLIVVGTLEGTAYGLAASDGAERWHAQLSSEVIAPPAIGGGLVAARTNDGRVFGLDERDGKRLWVFDHANVPILSLRGNSAPIIDSGVVYVGEDNGKVIALRATDGGEMWEQQIATGEGRGEIERIQDVDGMLAFDSGVVYAAGYRGQTAALIAQTGRPLWTHEVPSFTGVALSASQVYVGDADSSVWALDLRTGSSEWKQDGLKYRWIGQIGVQGDAIVVGDFEGFVHWLSITDGKFAARARLSKDPIEAAPIVVGDIVYVMDVEGEIGAFRVGAGK